MDDLPNHDTTPTKKNNNLEAPYEGMQFNSYEEAKEYYTKYGRRNGFTIRVRSTNRTRRGVGEVTNAYMMQILLNEDNSMWKVMAFSDEHNHKFLSPRKRMRMRSDKCMPEDVKDMTEKFHRENLEVGKVPVILDGQHIGFNKRDCWNHLRNVRHKNLELGDAQSVIDYLHKKQSENPQFFYRVQVDEHGRAVNFFWVDARSRLSYEQFGEVVFFDTTYRTNKYEMPFAPFTGVNHHYQTIQFGCDLLQDETEVTFSWLFSIWLEAMGEKHPSTIITDQDAAMVGVIKKVFPKARHRLCLWHIKKKFPEKLSQIYFKKSKFKGDMKECIHHTYKIQEFEERWKKKIIEFDLSNNEWLTDLYEIRESWVPVYEIHFMRLPLVSSKTNLREFAVRYAQAVKEIVDKEDSEDLISEHKIPNIDSRNLILKHGATIYTRNIYNKFREQLLDAQRFKSDEIERRDEFNTYLVTSKIGHPQQFTVKMKPGTYEGYCECQYFEFKGLPCKHVFKVLMKLEVDEIPPHFILKRLLKGANSFRIMDETLLFDNYENPDSFRLSHLCRRSTQLSCFASKSDTLYRMAIEVSSSKIQEDTEVDKSSHPFIADPHISQVKGRPAEKSKGKVNSSGRMLRSVEASVPKPRKCSLCEEFGHDKRKCPLKPDKEQLKIVEPSSTNENATTL
ncbi:protein FAR1-RELATED SEQUENCE 5-like [Papaver somniferum]|uniref:protein FAR1-RELATED SEQUENCE 5-like n=1 Tax=Papaver somniferum TaxID=3469 RepID=UPI000E6F57ED|nr:protein FAR1-RELATED SEQUENCE 5-like [Papaver somniferum]